MLKKKDLVKEFELIVKQEITEHNKAISASNLSLNNLNIKVDSECKLINSRLLKMQNRLDSLHREVEASHSSFSSTNDEFQKLKREQFNLNARNYNEIEIIDKSVETVNRNQIYSDKLIALLEEDLRTVDISINELIKREQLQDEKTSRKIVKAIKNLKEEILALPSEANAVKKEFMEELSMHKIDNKGLLKEIKALKKTVFINKKYIEHLNTLIERINKKLTQVVRE